MKLFTIVTIIISSTISLTHARLIQIIHTNDLHSYFEGTDNGRGGYAKLMTKVLQLREEARLKGVDVLQVDAGDWGEGTSFFLSNEGKDSLRALALLGTEVAVIGNHDHLVGREVLERQIRESRVPTKFIAANLFPAPGRVLGRNVFPYVDLVKGGVPIRIIGLTTDEAYFQYSVSPGKITPPAPTAEILGGLARASGRELVIALTHLGLAADRALARTSSTIDVIVGGHSHTRMSGAEFVRNKKDVLVPIVQSWAHGMSVGTLLLDVKAGGRVEVIDSRLHEIAGPLEQDPQMASLIENARTGRNEHLALNWDEVIGETKTPMTGYVDGNPVDRWTCWGHHLATAARRAVGAAVGIHVTSFEGMFKSAGPVTYGDLADNFPHFRKFGDQGWEIATVMLSGLKLRLLMYWINRRGLGVTFSGLGYKTLSDKSQGLFVGEDPLDEKGTYRVAFPAEVALAIRTSLPGYRDYLRKLKNTGKYYWPVVVDYLRERSPLSCP